MTFHDKIQEYKDAGLTVFPCEGGLVNPKKPVPKDWFNSNCGMDEFYTDWVGMACNGGIEVLDFDNKLLNARYVFIKVMQHCPFLNKLVINSTWSGGYHVIYKTESQDVNHKIAKQLDGFTDKPYTVIETRGFGGQIIVPPSPNYRTIKGTLSHIQWITEEERKWLFDRCLLFNEIYEEKVVYIPTKEDGNSFSSLFNSMHGSMNIAIECLKHFGWKNIYGYAWARPDVKHKSAEMLPEKNIFYIHSSNAAPFQENKGYKPFSIICELAYNNDYMACAKSLGDKYRQYF